MLLCFFFIFAFSLADSSAQAPGFVREIRARLTRPGTDYRDLLFDYVRKDTHTVDGVTKIDIQFIRPDGTVAATETAETRDLPQTGGPRPIAPEMTKSTIHDNQMNTDYAVKHIGHDVVFEAKSDSGTLSEERDSWGEDPNNPLISSALFPQLLERNAELLKAREEVRVQVGIHDMKMRVSFVMVRDDPQAPEPMQPERSIRIRLKPVSFFIKALAPQIYFYLDEATGKFLAWRGVVYLKDEVGSNPHDWKPAMTETIVVEDRTYPIPHEDRVPSAAPKSDPSSLTASRLKRN